MTTTRPTFTQTEAAAVTGTSRSTIKRRRLAGDFPNAFLGTDKQWRIPVEDLLAQGFTVGREPKDEGQHAPAHDPGSHAQVDLTALVNRLAAAEAALAVERERNVGLQNLNTEIQKRADLAESALKMLEAPKAQPVPTPPAEEPEELRRPGKLMPLPEPDRKKRWWNR